MESLRDKKQSYLRENILEANYDPNQFMDFCESQHNSINIDLWSFQQLTQIVQQFIKSKNVNEYDSYSGYQNQFNSGFQDSGFGEYQKQIKQESNIKTTVEPSISDQFNSWGSFIPEKQVQQKKSEQNFELNLLDLDFLSNMGGTSSNNPPPNPQPEFQKSKYMSVPSSIAKKLQEGNSNFIVGYNSSSLIPETQKTTSNKKLESKIKVNQLGNISGNIQSQSPSYQPSISPPSTFVKGTSSRQSFNVVLDTKKVVSKSKLSGNEEVNIISHEIINPNIFVPKYVLFCIHINPLNIDVKRRFKDFETLRDLLKKFFPSTQIPYLQRCSRLNETQNVMIQKQILFLESFLNNILMNKELKCKLVEEFLLCPDLDLLKKFFKEYEKLSKPRAIEGLFTTSGSVNIKLNNQNKVFLDNEANLINYMEQHFSKMKGLYDQLTQGFEQNMKTLKQIQQMHSNFKTKIKGINIQFTPQYQCPDLQKTLDRVQYLHRQWSQSFKTQAKIIKSQIRHLYRFQSSNVKTLSDLLKVENDIQQSYAKRGDKEIVNDEYSSKKLEEYKLNIENPSRNITVLKYQAGYFQEQCVQQCLRFLRQLSKKFDHKFKLFSQLQLSISHDMEGCWREFQAFYQ